MSTGTIVTNKIIQNGLSNLKFMLYEKTNFQRLKIGTSPTKEENPNRKLTEGKRKTTAVFFSSFINMATQNLIIATSPECLFNGARMLRIMHVNARKMKTKRLKKKTS